MDTVRRPAGEQPGRDERSRETFTANLVFCPASKSRGTGAPVGPAAADETKQDPVKRASLPGEPRFSPLFPLYQPNEILRRIPAALAFAPTFSNTGRAKDCRSNPGINLPRETLWDG